MEHKYYYRIVNDTTGKSDAYAEVNAPISPYALCKSYGLKGYRAELITQEEYEKNTEDFQECIKEVLKMPYINGEYRATNLDADKLRGRLKDMRDEAHQKHNENLAIEKARFQQELDDIHRFMQMLLCSNYEKSEEKTNV